jgi:hypothetical protein
MYKVTLSDGRQGTLQFVDVSPYWSEEVAGVQRAFIIGVSWSDYVLTSEIIGVL